MTRLVNLQDLEENKELKTYDKVDILGVMSGEKPVAWVFIEFPYSKIPYVKSVQNSKITDIATILRKLGMNCELGEEKLLNDNNRRLFGILSPKCHRCVGLYISRSQHDIEKIRQAVECKDDRMIGRLLGFPDTAVESYVSDTMLPVSEIPDYTDDITREEMSFLNYRLSKGNWQDEVGRLSKYAKNIKNLSPKIYRAYTKEFSK